MYKLKTLVMALGLAAFSTAALAQPAPVDDPIVTESRVLKTEPVEYSFFDRRFGHEGRVIVVVRLDADGIPLSAALDTSSGWQGLDDAALEAVMRYQYSSAKTRKGIAVPSAKLVMVNFVLQPPTEDVATLDLVHQAQLVLTSYYTYRKSSQTQLDACAGRGFNTEAASKGLQAVDRQMQEKLTRIESYLRQQDALTLDRIKDEFYVQRYEQHIKIDELRGDDVEVAKTRCRRIVDSFNRGVETFEHFDKTAYRLFNTIELRLI